MEQHLKKYQIIADFLRRLEEDGYPLGVGLHLKVQELSSLLPDDIPMDKLGNYLIPLLARNKEEQYRFKNHFQNALLLSSEINSNDFEIEETIDPQDIENKLKWLWWIIPLLLLFCFLYKYLPRDTVAPKSQSHIEIFQVEEDTKVSICLDTIPGFEWIIEKSAAETAPDSLREDAFGIYSFDNKNICLNYKAKDSIKYETKDSIVVADTIFFNWINSENQNVLVKYVPMIIPEKIVDDNPEKVEPPPLPPPPPTYKKQKLPYYESYQRLLPAALMPNEQFLVNNFWWLMLLSIVSGLLLLMALVREIFFKKIKEKDSTVVVDKESKTLPPYVWNIELEGDGNISLEEDIVLTIRQMRERAKDEGHELDVTKTIFSTIHQGGRFSPDFKQYSRSPEYLLLIEKRSPSDHRAMLSNALYKTFQENEILVERYFYETDIRLCFNEKFKDGIKLPDLVKKHGDSRLVIMGTATALLNPYSGKLEKWTRIFEAWKERVIMTPKTIDAWTRQENRLEETFTVIPNHHSILGAWTNTLKNDLDWDKGKWKSILPAAQTQAIGLEDDLISTLDKHYGSSLKLWIAACAVYPSLHWDLTIHLGHFLSRELGDEELVSFDHLSSICRLEWFVNGDIPDTVRADLMGFLQKEHPALFIKIRQQLNEILENNPPPTYSVAYEEHRMNMAINQLAFEKNPKKKKELENEIIANLKEGIDGDFDMLRKISKKQLNALAFQVSDKLAQYIKEDEEITEEKDAQGDDGKNKKKNLFYKIALGLLLLFNLIFIFNLNRTYETIRNNCKACNENNNSLENNAKKDLNLREFFLPSCTNVKRIPIEYDSQNICIVNHRDSLLHISHQGIHQIYSQASGDTSSLDYLEGLEILDDPNANVNFADTIIDHSRKVYENIAVAYYNKAVDIYDSLQYEIVVSQSTEQRPADETGQKRLAREQIQGTAICDLIQKAYGYDYRNVDVIQLMQDCGNLVAPINIVKGTVLDEKTGEPLPNVNILIDNKTKVNTNSEGEYELVHNEKFIIIELSKAWYDTYSFATEFITLLRTNGAEMKAMKLLPISYTARILDEKENPISNGELTNEKYGINLKTDEEGLFSLEGKPNFPDANISLNISAIGYENTTIIIYQNIDENPKGEDYILKSSNNNPTRETIIIDTETPSVLGDSNLEIVEDNGFLGIKKGNNFIVPQNYTEINPYETENGAIYFILKDKNSNYAFYQEKLQNPIGDYSYIGIISNNFAMVKKGNKWGFIHYNGTLIEPIYDGASDFRNGLAEVAKGNRNIKIDTTGKCVENCEDKNLEYQQKIEEADAYLNKGEMEQAKLLYLAAQKINDTEEVRAKIEKCASSGFKEPEMVYIRGGTFMMGCTAEQEADCRDNEKPVHEVTLSAYYIGKHEVTFAEYDVFCEETKKDKPDDEGWGRDNRPVINVSWDDAKAYAEWLSQKTGKKFRLPTEAEWEYAARGGEGYKYAGSDNLDEVAWYSNNSRKTTHIVGQKKPNGYGLYDMSGNVWEWCEDHWHKDYKGAPADGSAWIEEGSEENGRMVRGGSWYYVGDYCRVSFRYFSYRDGRGNLLGFRLVRY